MTYQLPDTLDLTDENAIWDYLEENDSYEVRVALFEALLPTSEMDNEMAFELLNGLFDEAIARNERDQFDGLVLTLQQQNPVVFQQEAHFMYDWLITNAIANGRYQDAHHYALELVQIASGQINMIIINLNKLAYHDQLDTITAMVQQLWQQLNQSTPENIPDWIMGDMALRASNYILFNYLESHDEPDFTDPDLLTELAQYVVPKPAGLDYHLKQLNNQSNHAWTLSDFEFTLQASESATDLIPQEIRNNMGDLSAEFLGYLRHVEDVSFAKGSLVNTTIADYIMRQLDKRIAASKITKKQTVVVPLIPDRVSFEEELLKFLNVFNPNPHIAAAMFDLVPAWLRFLESRGLIDASQRQQTLQSLASLTEAFTAFWGEHPADPILPFAAAQWREKAEVGN